ncbi:MAG: hypothetical protein ABIA04_04265 [Pseudomonadota bacterium]
MKKIVILTAFLIMFLGLLACDMSSGSGGTDNTSGEGTAGDLSGESNTSSSSGSSGTETSGSSDGEVILFGLLQVLDSNDSSVLKTNSKHAIASSYYAHVINTETQGQAVSQLEENGSFSFTLSSETSYIVNFLDSSMNYIGTLMTSAIDDLDYSVSIALTTSEDGEIDNIGTVTAYTDTGNITTNVDVAEDELMLAYTIDEVLAGGLTGDGTENYESAKIEDEVSAASDPDDDNDGTPDVFDSDNDNSGYVDEIDGQTDYCLVGDVSLYVENSPSGTGAVQEGFPTPAEIAEDLEAFTDYKLNMSFAPSEDSDYTMADFAKVSISGPSYLEAYSYVLDSADECYGELWDTCASMELTQGEDSFSISVSDTETAGILENMYSGDTFVFTITMADDDSTEYTCIKKINIIPKYYGYAFTKNGTAVDTSTNQVNWLPGFTLGWTVPNDVGPKGLTYEARFVPYTDNGDGTCTADTSAYGSISAGQDVASLTIQTVNEILEAAYSNAFHWALSICGLSANGDAACSGSVQFTTNLTSPCFTE